MYNSCLIILSLKKFSGTGTRDLGRFWRFLKSKWCLEMKFVISHSCIKFWEIPKLGQVQNSEIWEEGVISSRLCIFTLKTPSVMRMLKVRSHAPKARTFNFLLRPSIIEPLSLRVCWFRSKVYYDPQLLLRVGRYRRRTRFHQRPGRAYRKAN